jgi:3-oxoacyl-[acyl-carrier-protein] synthase II
VLIGTGLRELRSVELWHAGHCDLNVTELHFATALRDVCGLSGPVVTCSNACAAGNCVLGLAEDMINLGQSPLVLVAATDSITESMLGLTDRANMRAPVEALRPFDQERRGVLLGEGAAALVLELPSHAVRRGAHIKASLRSVGMNCDAHHETAPEFHSMCEAMRLAYARAGTTPSATNLLLAHGTGTLLNDKAEIQAFRMLFGEQASGVAITALKSLIGHTSGGSGLMSVITAVLCIQRGLVPPIAGLRQPIAESQGLDFVLHQPRSLEVHTVQVNAFGFGGINAVVLLERAA